jgi:hypothetical protein
VSERSPIPTPAGTARWWTYQKERFPIVAHGLLIFSFSFCAVSYSARVRDDGSHPSWIAIAVAFATCFLFFLQLRIADEFKDFHEDLAHRPYRPVQRGLVTLGELGVVFVVAAIVQAVLALVLDARLVVVLFGVWVYLALMSVEFFAGDRLRRLPILYMLSHMLIMPLIDFYATACDWLPASGAPGQMTWFLCASYSNGLVIEIGRKIRSPDDEEPGVQTYTAIWGRGRAMCAWCGVLMLTLALASLAACVTRTAGFTLVLLGSLALACLFLAYHVHRHPLPGRGKRIEFVAGLWTVSMYLALGGLPWLIR